MRDTAEPAIATRARIRGEQRDSKNERWAVLKIGQRIIGSGRAPDRPIMTDYRPKLLNTHRTGNLPVHPLFLKHPMTGNMG
jgi:hypothetical protein